MRNLLSNGHVGELRDVSVPTPLVSFWYGVLCAWCVHVVVKQRGRSLVQLCDKVKTRQKEKASGMKNRDANSMARDILQQVSQVLG